MYHDMTVREDDVDCTDQGSDTGAIVTWMHHRLWLMHGRA